MLEQYKSAIKFLSFYKERLNDPSQWASTIRLALIILLCSLTIYIQSCKKLVEIDPPVNSISSPEVFSNDFYATSAMNGIYYDMVNGSNPGIGRGSITIYSAFSSDELDLFNKANNNDNQFQQNSLSPNNFIVLQNFWQQAYSFIYRANAIIENVPNSSSVHDSVKTELIAEAKLVRALEYFYLINLYGDVPLTTTINWRTTNLLSRTSVTDVYLFIKSDLKDAQRDLSKDYSVGNGLRIIPNSFAATALLARVDLYTKDWANAEIEASKVINNSALYSLSTTLSPLFSVTSTEAIWQLKQDSSVYNFYSTYEGNTLIPGNGEAPFAYLTDSLLKSFEPGDLRKSNWVDSANYSSTNGKVYYFPRKYTIGPNQRSNAPFSEYYTVLRLSEQYLIRAEARAMQGNLSAAISDINVIRNRAGLTSLPNNGSLTQTQVMAAVQQENRIEFFAEWGHRWLDLKRWGIADAVLGPIKGTNWQTADQLYPIPQEELRVNPNLIQNAGY
jgi:hypothetical protein